jgi:hypothetical protein
MAGDVDKTVAAMSDEELIRTARQALDSDKCPANSYTVMVTDIVTRGGALSHKQRGVVEGFLERNSRLWY